MIERKTNVLVVDYPTGRSSALMDAYANHPDVGTVVVTSRNDISQSFFGKDKVKTYPGVRPDDPEAIASLVAHEQIDLVDIAQDVSVRAGIANKLRNIGILAVGPGSSPGRLEWDKIYSRKFARRNGIPIPEFTYFSDAESAIKFLDKLPPETALVVKANGLAEGKGVDVTDNIAEAKKAVQRIVNLPNGAGDKILCEKRVGGKNIKEVSGYYVGTFYQGKQLFTPLGVARDYKRVFDGNKGPNTGGMGAISSPGLVSVDLQNRIFDEMVIPTGNGLQKINHPYQGILYVGVLQNPDMNEIWLGEDNCRWGDPEAEVVVLSLSANNDFLDLSMKAARGGFYVPKPDLTINPNYKTYISVAGCSSGYPEDYSRVRGKKIEGLDQVIKRGRVRVYGAGIVKEDKDYYANGGRIFHLVAEADNPDSALSIVYEEMEIIHIPGDRPGEDLLHYRRDIGR